MKEKKEFIQEVKEQLDLSLDGLDRNTVFKINAARAKALDAKTGSKGWKLPLTGIASAAAVIVIALGIFNSSETGLKENDIEIVEMLSSDQGMELYENLEFYTWLAHNPEESSSGS